MKSNCSSKLKRWRDRGGKSRVALVSSLLIVIVIAGLIYFLRDGDVGGGGGSAETSVLRDLRVAIGELENVEVDAAEEALRKLKPQFPDNVSLQQNLAVATALRVRKIKERIDNPTLEPEETKAARGLFMPAADKARAEIEALQKLVPNSEAASFLSAKVALAQASLLPASIKRSDQKTVLDSLFSTLGQHPDWMTLAGPLLVDLLAQLKDDSLTQRAYPILGRVSDSQPRNLYIALQAMRTAAELRDPSVKKYVSRVATLGEPFVFYATKVAEPLQMTPAELAQKVLDAVDAGQWDSVATNAGFLNNCYNGTQAFRTDLKRLDPHELDLLSFELVGKLSTTDRAAAGSTLTPLSFEISDLGDDTILNGQAAAVTVVDFDLDDKDDVVSVVDNQLCVVTASENKWSVFASTEVPAGTVSLAVADLFIVDSSSRERIKSTRKLEPKRRNTYPSFIVSGKFGIRIWQANPEAETEADRLRVPQQATGLENVRDVTALEIADIEADGDLDLLVATRDAGIQIWLNKGNMTFFRVEEHSQMPPADSPAVDFAIGDYDRDLDIDVLAVFEDGSVGMLENMLHHQYRWVPWQTKAADNGNASIAIAELDGNVSWDSIVSSGEGLGGELTETTDVGAISRVDEVKGTCLSGKFSAIELNNDPWADFVVWSGDQIDVRSFGPSRSFEALATLGAGAQINDVAGGDLSESNGYDLVLATDNGLKLAKNTSPGIGNFLDAQYRGIDDNATGRVNHYAIGSTVELNFGPYYRAKIIDSQTARFGLGQYERAITLRAILTNGVTQNVIDPAANQRLIEEQSLKGSCPYLYGWDGEKFAFITDCLWAAPLGLQVARGKVVPDRPWEYLKVDGRFLKPRDGFYELRITEELWEIAYFDHLQLTAIDHPTGVEIFTNEKVGPPSIAEHRVFTFDEKHLRPIAHAKDKFDNDVTELLSEADRDFVQGHRERYRQGLCEPHWIELDLGEVSNDDEVQLVLTGWIYPTDTSLNIQIAQNPDLASVVHPVLEVPDGNGGWKTAIEFIGFPGGKTKTIVVDISGKLNPTDTRVRVRTSAEIYWDRAKLAVNQQPVPVKQHALSVASANLGFHGFSAQMPRTPSQPHRYDYDKVSRKMKWPPLQGNLSSYGDCARELSVWDDHMIVMAGGDELRLRFAVPSDPVPDGWTRDFVLHCVGWDKDADLNTLAGQSVGPLPFRAMTAYPPPVSQAKEAAEVNAINASRLTRQQEFREFWHPEAQ